MNPLTECPCCHMTHFMSDQHICSRSIYMQNHQGYRQKTQDINYPAIINAMVMEIASLKKKLAIAEAVLDELATGCTHDEKDENYRALCRGYGWCNLCVTKVSYKENIGKEALAAIREGK